MLGGTYQPAFHDILEGNATRGIVGKLPMNPTAAQIRSAIRATYEEMHEVYGTMDGVDYRAMGDMVDAWVTSKGVP